MEHLINVNRPVRVFRNLTHGCYSILQGGQLRASASQVQLSLVEFRVRASGRERARRTNP